MKKVQIITDSTADIEKNYREQYGIEYVKMVFTIKEKTYDANLDWEEISADDYYNLMRNGNRSVTGLVKTIEIENLVKKAFDAGLDVLYIACSSKLSGSIGNAKIAIDEILPNYPSRKAICFDSLRSNYAEGLMAIDAAKMANEGLEIEQIVEKLEETKLNYQTFATVGSLEWLKKAGRVKASAAFFGNIFGVKPLICGDANGNNTAFKKVRGRKTSLDELIQICKDRIIDPQNATVFIEHANCLEDANYVAEQIKQLVKPSKVNLSNLGPIIGATTGPDTITINFYGEKVEIVSEE